MIVRAITFLRPTYLAGLTAVLSASICLAQPTEASSSLTTKCLNGQGYCIMNSFVDSDKVASILSSLSSHGEINRYKEVSKGRLHYNLLRSTFVESKVIKDLIAEHLLPIAVSELGVEVNQMVMTEVQVVDSLPGSDIQIWHADNAKRGITFIIPLVDLTNQNGPTELITGSHSLWNNTFGWICGYGGENGFSLSLVKPLLRSGDCLIMDARLLHRGGANLSDTSRPILVIRYDSVKSQPPGMTVIGATARFYFARVICFLIEFR